MATQRCTGLDSKPLRAFVLQKAIFPPFRGIRLCLNGITSDQKVLFSVLYVGVLCRTVTFVIQLELVKVFSSSSTCFVRLGHKHQNLNVSVHWLFNAI